MTLLEAAASLGVTAATLRQQIANGKLRAKKVGRDWQVTRREVERYRAASQPCSGPDGEDMEWCSWHDARWPEGEKYCDARR